MQPRLNFYTASPNAIKVMRNAEDFIAKSSIEKPLAELVRLRASQINGCAFCVDMHTTDARKGGETDRRLATVDFAFMQTTLIDELVNFKEGFSRALIEIRHGPNGGAHERGYSAAQRRARVAACRERLMRKRRGTQS